jgi:endonuclease-3
MPDLKAALVALERRYGRPELPPAKGPFQLVLWENACYLLPDSRRTEVFEGLRQQVGLSAEAIWKAPDEVLLPLALRGGMRPETRVFRWREIARITQQQFDGDLDQILTWEYAKARKALKQFPNIGEPGAEKILMYCGMAAGLPLESNGLRVLVRIGYGRAHLKNYGAMYKSAQEAIAAELPTGAAQLTRAHLLLRTHGKTTCKDGMPLCSDCPIAQQCRFLAK